VGLLGNLCQVEAIASGFNSEIRKSDGDTRRLFDALLGVSAPEVLIELFR